MGKIAEAYVEVSAKTQEFDKGLDSSKGKLTEWVGSAQKLVAAFVIAKVGQEFLSFMSGATKAASDLAESANKAGVAFGDSFPKVSKFADEMAQKFGVVKTEIFDLTAGLGFMLTNAKLTKDVASDLAIALAKSATDVSSIQNMPVATVLEKMRAGISGEAEPLRPLGVNISEENVKKQAATMGFGGSKELTDQEKILARIALIINGLSYSQGDLEKTITEYASATRKAQGDWENFKALMGEQIKPVVLELIKAGYDLKDAFNEAFGGDAIAAFSSYLGQVATTIKDLRQGTAGTVGGMLGTVAKKGWQVATGDVDGLTGKNITGAAQAALQGDTKGIVKALTTEPPKLQAPAVTSAKPVPLTETAKETADRAAEKMAADRQKKIDDRNKAWNTPAGQALNGLGDAFGQLKRSLGNVGGLGNAAAGFLNGGVAGAVKGAAEGGLLNPITRRVAQQQVGVGTISSHIMSGSDFANFAQEQVSSGQNAQLEAAKETAKQTAETVSQLKGVLEAVKNLGNLKGGAILRGGGG